MPPLRRCVSLNTESCRKISDGSCKLGGRQVPAKPAIGCARRALHRAPFNPGLHRSGDERSPTSRSARAPPPKASSGRAWKAPPPGCTCRCAQAALDNGYVRSRRVVRSGAGCRSRRWWSGFVSLHRPIDGSRVYFGGPRNRRRRHRPRAGIGPVLVHAIVTRPYAFVVRTTRRSTAARRATLLRPSTILILLMETRFPSRRRHRLRRVPTR